MEKIYNTSKIHTLEELITACDIDTSIWNIDKVVINKWDAAAKSESTGELETTPLFQVKVWLSPKLANLEPAHAPAYEFPILSTENLAASPVETAIFLPDMQIGYEWNADNTYLNPFHDREAIDTALQFCYAVQPKYIYLLGDFLDLPMLSKFSNAIHNKYSNTLQPAIEEGYYVLRKLRTLCPSACIRFIMGNHDIRLEKFIAGFRSEIGGLRLAGDIKPALSVSNLLRLQELNIEYVGTYDTFSWLWDKICVRHGEEYANLKVEKLEYSTIQGHMHKLIMQTKMTQTPHGQELITLASPGCLCKLDGTVPSYSKNVNWQQGVGIAFYDPNDKISPIIQMVPIHAGTLFYGNKVYKAQNPSYLAEQVSKATGVKQFVM